MITHFVTGFPGLLATVLAHELLQEESARRILCLVHPSQHSLARRRWEHLARLHPGAQQRIHLVKGDLTLPGLGVSPSELRGVEELEGLAAELAPRVRVNADPGVAPPSPRSLAATGAASRP